MCCVSAREGGIMALVAYPMNELANIQMGQIRKFLGGPNVSPVR